MNVNVNVNVPLGCCAQVLYESRFDACFIIVQDTFKRAVVYSDAFPATIKLEKGAYTIRLQVRHDNPALLEALKAMPLTLERKLASSVRKASCVRV